jgi:hypothetical protein
MKTEVSEKRPRKLAYLKKIKFGYTAGWMPVLVDADKKDVPWPRAPWLDEPEEQDENQTG